jgi:hypothetical protein
MPFNCNPAQYGTYLLQCVHQADREWLPEQFLQRCFGRRGPVEWLPRSPDLTRLDFHLCDHLKAKVYAVKVCNVGHLQERIVMRAVRSCHKQFTEFSWIARLRWREWCTCRVYFVLVVSGVACGSTLMGHSVDSLYNCFVALKHRKKLSFICPLPRIFC